MLKAIALFIALTGTTGCTIVRVYGAEGVRQTKLGLFSMKPDTETGFVAVKTRGGGLLVQPDEITLGYMSKDEVFLTDVSQCRIVVFEFPTDEGTRAALSEAIRQGDSVCTVKNEGHGREIKSQDD